MLTHNGDWLVHPTAPWLAPPLSWMYTKAVALGIEERIDPVSGDVNQFPNSFTL